MTDQFEERTGRGPAFWVIVGIAALLVGLMAWIFAGRADPEGGYNARQPENIPLAGAQLSGMELPLLDGSGTLALDDLRGQVLVINFFASYCIPCRGEHAELTGVFDAYRDQGVQFIGVVYQDTTANAVRFLDELGWGDGYIYAQDPGSRAIVEFGVFGVPETYFVDADGIIVDKHYGAIDRTVLIPTLDAILAGELKG